jgi:nucleotide-binding universal stress UspA family protein
MTIRHITLLLTPQLPSSDQHALEVACAMASRLSAELRVLIYPITTDGPVGEELAHAFDAARHTVLGQAEQAGVKASVADRSSFAYGIGEVFADYLKVSDLGIIPVGHSIEVHVRMLLVQGVFNSGRPILLLPESSTLMGLPKRMMVGWDSSAAAARTLQASLPLAAHADETIVAVVSQDKEIRLDQSGVEAARYVAMHGGRATFRDIPRARNSPLQALFAECESANIDVLALGAVRHSPWRDLLFGGVTRELLDRPPSRPVLLMA